MKLVSSLLATLAAGACALTGVVAPASGTAATAARTRPRVLFSGTVLFVDGHAIAGTRNLRRAYVPGTKVRVDDLPAGRVAATPVFHYLGASKADDRADGDTDIDSSEGISITSVLADTRDGQPFYRMYVRSGSSTGYRESTDGLHWTVHDPDSVVILKGITQASVMRDPHTGSYYLIGWKASVHRFVEYISADGIDFTPTSDFSGTLSRLHGDVVSAAADRVTGALDAIAKQPVTRGATCRTKPRTLGGGRTFGVSSSTAPSRDDDASLSARVWAAPRQPISADCVDALSVPSVAGTVRPGQLYGMPFTRYGDQVLGFPWFFQITRTTGAEADGYTDGYVDTQIASTPDVLTTPWQREQPTLLRGSRHMRPSIITRGPRGAWDDGMVFGHPDLVTLGNHVLLYYAGYDGTHLPSPARKVAVGAVEWRRDGFVGLRVGDARRPGVLTTRPFRLPTGATARGLHLNAVVASGRGLTVAVLDAATGRPIAGFGDADSTVVTGNRLDATVTWHGRTLGSLGTRPVRLRMQLGGGTLYSFQVR